ncbi:hypothetical protein M2169_001491 [Streptomyces sp. MJP52]|nr:hypothetical protein [Streptomyces sp. MJP52]
MTVRLDRRSRPEPDVLVPTAAYDPDRTWYAPEEVTLVVEVVEVVVVVSEGSADRDRPLKPFKYAQAGIAHFWRVEDEAGAPAVHTYELDTMTRTYVPAGIHRDRLKVSLAWTMSTPPKASAASATQERTDSSSVTSRAGSECGAAFAGDEAPGLDGFPVQQVAAHHERALGREPQRGGPALAARGAGDQRGLALQPLHEAPSRSASETDLTPPCAVRPLSTGISAPVMNEDSSDSRKTTGGATSSTVPVRPSGASRTSASRKAGAAEAVVPVST